MKLEIDKIQEAYERSIINEEFNEEPSSIIKDLMMIRDSAIDAIKSYNEDDMVNTKYKTKAISNLSTTLLRKMVNFPKVGVRK